MNDRRYRCHLHLGNWYEPNIDDSFTSTRNVAL
jgi:hypothetical protein